MNALKVLYTVLWFFIVFSDLIQNVVLMSVDKLFHYLIVAIWYLIKEFLTHSFHSDIGDPKAS